MSKLYNLLLSACSALSLLALDSSWDLIGSGNSFLLFGEPTYPSEK